MAEVLLTDNGRVNPASTLRAFLILIKTSACRWLKAGDMPMRLAFAMLALVLLALAPAYRDGATRDPFGGTTVTETAGPWVTAWRQEQALLPVTDERAVDACLADGVPGCEAARRLLDIVAEANGYQGKARLAHINRAVNLLIKWTPIAWLGPLETIALGFGDCKDYAIAKFFALREARVPPQDLRLVIVHNRRLNEDHMIVAVRDSGGWIILDNRTMALVSDVDDAAVYTPLFVLDGEGVRRYVGAANS